MNNWPNKNWLNEIIAGLIGYLTTVYIVVVNSSILSDAGINREDAMIATILASAIGCLLVGIWARVPIIIIPGMGVNALFAYSIVEQYQFTYEQGLGVVVVSGLIFLLTAITPLGEAFKQAIPDALKHGITIGLGLFLVLIGLENGGLIVSGEHSIISLGDFSSPSVIVSLLSLLVGVILFVKNVPANFLLTMVIGTGIAYVFGTLDTEQTSITAENIANFLVLPTFGHMVDFTFWIAVLPLAIVLIFESMGLLHGQLDMIDRHESFHRANKSSAITAMLSGFLGTSPTIPAAETAAVTAAKGRTGLASIVIGLLFLSTFFLIPYISLVPANAISPILIIVGVLMMQSIKHINIDDMTEAFPTFLIMFMIPFTYSIADGMAFGFIAYPIVKIVSGRKQELKPLMILISILFLIEFILKGIM
ncbi:NCS2 family permease [Alkalibacillus almallahensis]|uniref:NCS2 family permease n=1 Tax=Alkalibacillus almallahensis TaxID=1379154 RepID=UPI00142376CE|nr:NCS2 family permease [Alkalibacillus almallahensis]NIK10747.1 AGZA family xanthine/uracil permease-like MFS transporter [Alkalibacillus almallahensis]